MEYLQIKNITEKTADIYFYGAIVGEEWDKWSNTDTCPKDVIDALQDAEGKDLNIYINSPGGSVFAGLAIYNMLIRHNGKKTVYIDGMAASIASVIAMAGDRIIIPENAYLMIHKPINYVYGNAQEMRKIADDLDNIQKGIEITYNTKLTDGVAIDTIIELMNRESWLTGQEAAQYFQVEVPAANATAACADTEFIKNYKNIPAEFLNITNPHPTQGQDDTIKNKLKLELELLNI